MGIPWPPLRESIELQPGGAATWAEKGERKQTSFTNNLEPFTTFFFSCSLKSTNPPLRQDLANVLLCSVIDQQPTV